MFRDLRAAGYDVVPVNPNATEVDGRPCYPSVTAAVEATGPVDIVDVFRRAEDCLEPAREAVAVGRALPVAAAGDRVAGRRPARPRGGPGGGHGPLHDRGGPAAGGALTRSGAPSGVSAVAMLR